MALPPGHISIKRHREEEPVDTLYIQSELHHNKRRFTDFVFHRVQFGSDASNDPASPRQDTRSSRAVSSSVCTNLNDSARQSPGQVPLVRATSPGAEFREERLLAAARKDRQDKIKVHSNASLQTPAATPDHFTYFPGGLSPHSVTTSLRRFHISRPSTSIDCLKVTGAGIQKRRDGIPARVILVEKLNRTPLSRRVSNLEGLIKAAASPSVSAGTQTELTGGDGKQLPEPKPQLRKRPIINSAEKRWREQQKATISAAKARLLSSYNEEAEISLDDSDDSREKLAREFEQIALELRHPDIEMKQAESIQVSDLSASEESLPVNPPPKYRPRPLASNKRGNLISTAQTRTENLMEDKAYESQDAMQMDPPNSSHDIKQDCENSGKEYVYDIYVRRPLHVGQTFANPLAGIEAGNGQTGIDTTRTGIGVVVITQEEEELWAPFVEEDEEEDQWDNADDDSNAEDNPANDYPDEELSSADEDDDPAAIYRKYRSGASDDEEYGVYDEDDEDEFADFKRSGQSIARDDDMEHLMRD